MSKLTKQVIPEEQAAERHWEGTRNGNGTVTVGMCVQCQIDRAERLQEKLTARRVGAITRSGLGRPAIRRRGDVSREQYRDQVQG